MDKGINSRDEVGATRLFEAVSDEDVAEASRLLSLGADPNIPEVNGITPLMDAASGGNSEMVELLLEHGFIEHIVPRPDLGSEVARVIDLCGL